MEALEEPRPTTAPLSSTSRTRRSRTMSPVPMSQTHRKRVPDDPIMLLFQDLFAPPPKKIPTTPRNIEHLTKLATPRNPRTKPDESKKETEPTTLLTGPRTFDELPDRIKNFYNTRLKQNLLYQEKIRDAIAKQMEEEKKVETRIKKQREASDLDAVVRLFLATV